MNIKTLILLALFFAFSSPFAQAEQAKIHKAQYSERHEALMVIGKVKHKRQTRHQHQERKNIKIVDANNPDFVLAEKTVRRSFNTKIQVNELDYIPCQIGVIVNGDIDQMARAEVRRAPDQCVGFAMTITGVITDEPIPFATVSVTLDGQTFTTTANALGEYSLDVLTKDIEQLLVIESTAIQDETGDEINFVNMVGTFAKVLSDPEPVNVTNVTTASYTLLVKANGGTPPTTKAELQTAETSVDATELFKLAAIIKLIVDDSNYSLPDGYNSVLDFVNDTVAIETFIANTPEADLTEAVEDILADSDLVAGFNVNDIPSLYYAIAVTTPGFISRSGSALEFIKTNQTGNSLGFNSPTGQTLNEAFTWSIVNGSIEVVYDQPETVAFLFTQIEDVTDDPLEIAAFVAGGGTNDKFFSNRTVQQRTYTRIVDGNLVDIISVETRSSLTTPPITLVDGSVLTIAAPKIQITTNNQTFRSSLDVTPIAFDDSCSTGGTCVLGKWGGLYHYSEGPRVYDDYTFPESAYAELISFTADNATQGQISNRSATWEVDNEGRLVITYSNGMVQTSQILDQNGLEYGVFSSFDNGFDRFASYDIWVKGDSNFVLNANYLQPSSGTDFWNGEVNSWIPGSIEANGLLLFSRIFGWAFTPNEVVNISANDWSLPNSNGLSTLEFVSSPPISYDVQDDLVIINRYPYAKRNWLPISSTTIDGDRVFYIIEREERDAALWYGGEAGYKTYIPARMNIERERDRANYVEVQR